MSKRKGKKESTMSDRRRVHSAMQVGSFEVTPEVAASTERMLDACDALESQEIQRPKAASPSVAGPLPVALRRTGSTVRVK
jgi:hypothetical protein